MINNDFVIDSEQALLGCVISENGSFDDIEGLQSHEFYLESHRLIFATISDFLDNGKSVDLILLAEALQKNGDLERVGQLKYLGELVQSSSSRKNIKWHAKRVSETFKLRKLKVLLASLSDAIGERNDLDSITEMAESGLFDLLEGKHEENFQHIGDAVVEAVDWEDQDQKGLQTGLRDLDRMTGGFKNSELIIVAGRPSMGKSTLAMQIGEHVARNESVIIFSLEMANRQVAARFLKHHESVIGKSQAIAHLKSLRLHSDQTPAITIGHIRSKCRAIKRKYGLSMIVVDYLQLMRGSGDNRNQEIGSISRGLKGIAKEFAMPVVCLSQLSRKVDDRADKRPIMSDLRESGEIEQDADVILFIYRDEVYNKETNDDGLAEIICRKNRNGSIGEIVTKFSGETTRFSDFNGERKPSNAHSNKRGFDV
jgi:replicative DNA helicase